MVCRWEGKNHDMNYLMTMIIQNQYDITVMG